MSDSQTQIRSSARRARESFGIQRATMASAKIAAAVTSLPEFLSAKTVACYLAIPGEVDTGEVIASAWAREKRVFLPVTGSNSSMNFHEHTEDLPLVTSKLGIEEPVNGDKIPASELDLVIVPLVAFDKDGNRIGMGGGYYDRAFSFLGDQQQTTKPLLVGIAFECQRVEEITPNPWDIPLSCVLTESGKYSV